ncbi:MAG: hypothetical protein ACRDZX_18240 [Acidimicrobiales bacterium]
MRFQELRDADGAVLARGLHPAITVVAADAVGRAAAVSAIVATAGCKVLHASDVEDQLKRAADAAVGQHEATLEEQRRAVAEAERARQEAADVAASASRETSAASEDLTRFDDLATRLSASEETYEAAVRADAEAARSVAATLGDLDRILGQRHSASTSLEQARSSRDNRGVPEAVVHQAMNLQAALAKAEAEKHEAVRQADETSQAARAASRDAYLTLEAAHTALRAGMALITSGAPNWGAGIPLPGLVANYRDHLAAAFTAAQAAEAQSKSTERAASSRLDQARGDLEALDSAGPGLLDPQATIADWLSGERFNRDDAVLVDDAFCPFGPDGVAALLTTLGGRGCQVIYLTDDAQVLSWAIGLPTEAGAANTISASRSRKPAFVGD